MYKKMEYSVFVFLSLIVGCLSEICYKSYASGYLYSVYCSGYCYGYYGNEYCSNRSSVSGGSIAGMVVGFLILVAIVVAIVVICKKMQVTRGRRGGIFTTGGHNTHVAVSHTTTTGFVQHPGPAGYPPPPAYGNVNQYPNMAAYPPTYNQMGTQGIGPSAPVFGYSNPSQPKYASNFNSMPPPHI